MTARRIPKFADKLRAALADAKLPDPVLTPLTVHVDGPSTYSPDPTVYVQIEYKPGSYARACYRTDARNALDLDPAVIIAACRAEADKDARDLRFTDEARAAARDLADVLTEWCDDRAAVTCDTVTA